MPSENLPDQHGDAIDEPAEVSGPTAAGDSTLDPSISAHYSRRARTARRAQGKSSSITDAEALARVGELLADESDGPS